MHVKCPMVNSVSLYMVSRLLVGKKKLVTQVRQVVWIFRYMVSRLLVSKKKLVTQVGKLCGCSDIWFVVTQVLLISRFMVSGG